MKTFQIFEDRMVLLYFFLRVLQKISFVEHGQHRHRSKSIDQDKVAFGLMSLKDSMEQASASN